LEALFRRRFFVVHLAFLALAAFLAAKTVNTVAAHVVMKKIGEAEANKPPARKTTAAGRITTRDFERAANENIFEGRREIYVEQAAEVVDTGGGGGGVEECGGSAQTFSINECEAVAVDPGDPNAALAGKAPPCSKVGDSATVKRIEPERVCIWNETDSRMEYLALNEPPAAGPVVASAPKSEAPADDELGKNIRKTGETSYEVAQSEVDAALSNLTALSTQARIVPAFEGGKAVGFKLFSIRPGSLYSKIGLQNGDVISRVNGYEMTSPDKALELYQKLKDTKQVTVDVKRRGKPTTLDYSITP
jgi:general secretion pathway protein C